MGDPQTAVDDLLAQRRIRSSQVAEWLARAEALRQNVEEVISTLSNLGTDGIDGASPALALRIGRESLRELDAEVVRLQTLQRRLTRDALSLGMLGRSGTGKSRFLRSLTGLSDVEIPDARGAAKTGVPSVVSNGTPPKTTVFFLTEREYMERIAKFFTGLELGTPPRTPTEFWGKPLPSPARDDASFLDLRGHHENGDVIRPLLGAAPRDISSEEIVEYVAQSGRDSVPQSKFRAVSRVEIRTPFVSGLKHVTVIDLPGLGETDLNHERLVVSSLRDDVDVLILLKRPDEIRDFWGDDEKNLRRLADDAQPDIALEDRSVVVLNHFQAEGRDNAKQAERLLEDLKDKPEVFMPAFADIVDASSVAAVERLYARVVDELTPRVVEGDRRLLEVRISAWSRVADSVQRFVSAGKGLLGDAVTMTPMWRLDRAHEARTRLQIALAPLRTSSGDDGEMLRRLQLAFDEALQQAMALADDVGVERFVRMKAANKNSTALAYGLLLDEQHARLIRHFAGLEPVLEHYLQEVKAQVAGIFLAEGLFSELVASEGAAALEAILRLLRDSSVGLESESPVLDGFQRFIAQRLDYRSILGSHINDALRLLSSSSPWVSLESLTPGHAAKTPREANPVLWDTDAIPDAMVTDLVRAAGAYVLYEAVEASSSDIGASALTRPGGVKGVLDRALAEPAREVETIVANFVETILDSPHAGDEWLAVYQKFAPQIWATEFSKATQNSETLSRVDAALNALSAANLELEKALPHTLRGDDGQA